MLPKPFIRGDYKELVQLTLLYFKVKDSDFERFELPSAIHKARWMAKMLLGTLIDIRNKSIVQNLAKGAVFGGGQQKKMKHFVKFVMVCYVPWWITAPLPADAPQNDLLLVNNLIDYRKIDKPCADAALKALSLRMWYLSEKLAPLSFFSDLTMSQMISKRKWWKSF